MTDLNRHVALETCFNFRDLGGYRATHGQTVRWGCVFRSDSLRSLTSADFAVLSGLGVRTVVDLRSTKELESEGRSAHLGELDYHHAPLFEQEPLPDPRPGEMYLAIAAARGESLAGSLRTIAECDHAVVFHCAAGKDRTGILAAMLLAALGVPDESIIADYVLSGRALEPWLAWAKVSDPKLAEEIEALPGWLLRASPEFMRSFLDGIRSRYGSVENYLGEIGAGADVTRTLRSRLLE